MAEQIAQVSLLVHDYDEAIEFYTTRLGFVVIEDSQLTETKRWVLIAPKNSGGVNLLLAKATDELQKSRVGDQTGGRVFLFLFTDDFKNYFQFLSDNHVNIIQQPIKHNYGTVAVFADLYGNLWDLIEKK